MQNIGILKINEQAKKFQVYAIKKHGFETRSKS